MATILATRTSLPQVLCTRPEEQNEMWAGKLRALGLQTVTIPALEIEHFSLDKCSLVQATQSSQENHLHATLDKRLTFASSTSLYKSVVGFNHLIYVSRNAVTGLAELFKELPASPPAALKEKTLLTGNSDLRLRHWPVGKMTGQLFDERLKVFMPGLRMPSPAGMNSASLFEQLKPLLSRDDKVLMIRGKGGLPYLADALLRDGVAVDLLEIYQRKAPDDLCKRARNLHTDLQASRAQSIITAFSGETLTNLVSAFDQNGVDIRSWLVVVPQERVATLAQTMGFRSIVQAKNASEQEMLNSTHEAAISHAPIRG